MIKFFCIIALLFTSHLIHSQSVISKTVYHSNIPAENYQLFRITTLKARVNNGLFERAMQQNDIIGNDYSGDKRIFGINANRDGSYTATNFHPVEGDRSGYKRTFCGTLHSYYYSNGRVDKDQCIELEIDENNPLLKKWEHRYNYYNTPWRDYNGRLQYPFFNPWNIIEGEINNGRQEATFSFSRLQSTVCMYGPWVFELFDPSEKILGQGEHGNNNEIHPIEQFWYKDKPFGEGNTSYRMNFFVDGSNRFNLDEEYSILVADKLYFKPWSKVPMDGKFYMAFEINLKQKERLTYWIETIKSFGVKPVEQDGRNHFLLYGVDTLINLFEGAAENINIGFDNVGYKPLKGNRSDSSVLQGFIVFSSRITGPNLVWFLNDIGHLEVRVEKQTLSAAKQTLLFTIEKIERLQSNSFRYKNPVTNEIYTDPQNVFNENQVFISLSAGNQSASRTVLELNTGQVQPFNRFQIVRKGFLSDEYRFEIFCSNGADGPELGKLVISGKELVTNGKIRKTVLFYTMQDYQPNQLRRNDNDHANPTYSVSLFAITYKINAIQDNSDPNNKN